MLREIAEYPNSFAPLAADSERIETPRYTLCMGRGLSWNTVQRQRFDAAEIDDVMAEVHAHLRERGRGSTQWEVGSAAEPAGLVDLLHAGPDHPGRVDVPADPRAGRLRAGRPYPHPARRVRRARLLQV